MCLMVNQTTQNAPDKGRFLFKGCSLKLSLSLYQQHQILVASLPYRIP